MQAKIRSKKAQFYIVGAIILCGLAVSLVTTTVLARNNRTIFDEFRLNFMRESSYAINAAYGSGRDVPATFEEFVESFRNYADERNLEFDLVYLLRVDDTIYIKNYLDDPINIQSTSGSWTLASEETANITVSSTMYLERDPDEFSFTFDDSPTQLRAIFEMKIK